MNIASILIQAVDRYPNKEALVFGERRWTYAQWNARINRLAQGLVELGVRPFDRVALYLSTDEASVTTYFACQKLGAVAVPMNFRLAAGEVAHILRDSGARLLVYSHSLLANTLDAQKQVHSVHDFISVGAPPDEIPEGHFRFETLAESGDGSVEPAYRAAPEHLSALVYTSGTTGRAKGVMHTHGNDLAISMNCVMEYSLTPSDRALHIAPLYHVGGMQAFYLPHMFVGGTNVVEGRYQALKTLETIEAQRITTLFAVPTQIQEMLFHPRFKEFDVSSLRMITTGGAAIASATMERVLDEFCPNLFNGYGMTEASLTLLLHPRDALAKLGSCGKPTLISNARIITHDPARDVRPDEVVRHSEVGQLVVQGPQMMPGYWSNTLETDKKLKYGWLYTGDLFSRDEDGYFTFHGRADDMIVSGGENIYPREVEEVLYRCPGVKEAAVVGLPDPKWGSVVSAFIVRAEPHLTVEQVDDFCRNSGLIAAFKRPRQIRFLDELPVNPSGKVLKRELVSQYGQGAPA
ncbi:AMP-dependent synthetase [Parazoarcus communis]|uniref:AMP-dependent synthetase n=1 Tax=Parazoarcus communis TaxID=41977 RepID=A0A2U8H4U5_9RHOO|nr:AMP-binding protein [Parazoarcus communis]AWI80633.1 AMP-dependent synthetase [Parazoarcus communis]